MISGDVAAPVKSPLLTQFVWMTAPVSGLYYSAITPGMIVRQDTIGGTIKDAFGDAIAEVLVPQNGLVLFSVTSLAINAGDPVSAVAGP